MTLDQESGMRGEEAANWAQRLGINLRFKAPNQKAWVVERHNEILSCTKVKVCRSKVQVKYEII